MKVSEEPGGLPVAVVFSSERYSKWGFPHAFALHLSTGRVVGLPSCRKGPASLDAKDCLVWFGLVFDSGSYVSWAGLKFFM